MDRFEFSATFEADKESRTIRGLAIPADATAEKAGRLWRFLHGSVEFGDRTPLLQYHDATRPVGKLTSAEWTERGLEVVFKVSDTVAGTETLTLAADGVLGFSVGIDVPEKGGRFVGKEFRVSKAFGKEVSLTPVPAFAGSVVDSVSLSEEDGAAMPETNTAADTAALTTAIASLTEKFEAFANRPETQPVPVTTVKEEPLYRFDGESGQYDFATDLKLASRGDSAAHARLDSYIEETFAVTPGNVSALTPNGYRQDLYVGQRNYTRTLTRVITQSTVNDLTPFAFPKLTGRTGPWVSPHTPGVEPALAGGATWGTQTITPSALSGKVEILREVMDLAGAQVSGLMWNTFLEQSARAAEARVVAMLDGLTLPTEQVVIVDGTGTDLIDRVDEVLLDLAEPDRFAGLVAASGLYKDLYKARDNAGRRLVNTVGQAVNADGTANGRRSLDINGLLAFQSKDTANSYLIDPSTVYQFLSTPRRLDFDIQVKSVYVGFWQYAAEAITDTTGIIRVTHAS